MRRAAIIALALGSCLALAACGESTLTRIATVAQAPPTSTTVHEGLGGRSPGSVLAASADALGRVRSYHVEATQTDDDGVTRITADVTADGRFHGIMRTGPELIDVIAIGSDTYLKANRAYWEKIGGSRATHLSLLADRWVKAPDAATAGLRDTLDKLQPDHLAQCMRKASTARGVINDGLRTWHGRPVVVLRDPGRQPGSSPSELWLSATGAPLTVRETQSGPRVPGGRVDPECGDEDSTIRKADSVFSDYDKPVRIVVPPGALDLDRLAPPRNLTPA